MLQRFKTLFTILKRPVVFLSERLGGKATAKNFKEPECDIQYDGYSIKKDKIRNIIIDCSVVDSFSVPHITASPSTGFFFDHIL